MTKRQRGCLVFISLVVGCGFLFWGPTWVADHTAWGRHVNGVLTGLFMAFFLWHTAFRKNAGVAFARWSRWDKVYVAIWVVLMGSSTYVFIRDVWEAVRG